MKEKFLQFFTGKMSKSIYISIAAAVVCGAVVITSVVVVHSNNQKIDAVLESLSASESVTELVTETVTESVPVSDNTESQPQAKAANNEPAGDKALQYLAEYDKLTAEYQAKRAELDEKSIMRLEPVHPQKRNWTPNPNISPEDISKHQAEIDNEYSENVSRWGVEHAAWEAESQKSEQACRELEELKSQYEKDVAALKAKYGIV